MAKNEKLEKLKEEIERNKSLPLQESNLVLGEGDPDCQVLFIGEAPGFNEDRERRPFVGRAGQLLRKNIRDLGWQEGDVYITNIVKRRPPENRDPNEEEIEKYKPYLARQIDIISPRIIVPLGRFSMNYFLPAAKITRDQGKLFNIEEFAGARLPDGQGRAGIFVFPMLHPAAALRGNGTMKMFEETFKKLPAALEKIKTNNLAETKPEQATTKQKKIEDVQSKLF